MAGARATATAAADRRPVNTPRDTDEPKARLSVWPVYVTAVVVAVVRLGVLAIVRCSGEAGRPGTSGTLDDHGFLFQTAYNR